MLVQAAIAVVVRNHAPRWQRWMNAYGLESSAAAWTCTCGALLKPDAADWPEHVAAAIERAQAPWPLLTPCHGRPLAQCSSGGAAPIMSLVCSEPGCPNVWSSEGVPAAVKRNADGQLR